MPTVGAARRTLSDHSRVAVTTAYAVQGLGFAVMLTHIPAYKRALEIDDDVVTLAILAVCVAAAAGSALSGLVAARVGSARVVVGGLLVAAFGMLGVGAAGGLGTFFTAFVLYGLALGAVDASLNMQGVALERRRGTSLLGSFFAANAAGGVLGALAVSGSEALDLGLGTSNLVVACVMVVVVLWASRGLVGPVEAGEVSDVVATAASSGGLAPGEPGPGGHVPGSHVPGGHVPGSHVPGGHVPGSHVPGDHVPGAPVVDAPVTDAPVTDGLAPGAPGPGDAGVPGPGEGTDGSASPAVRGPGVAAGVVLVLGFAMVAYPIGDSAVSSWGSVFLDDVLHAGDVVLPLGYAAYQAAVIVSRLAADALVARWGRVRLVRAGGLLGAAGFALVGLAPHWTLALLGFAAVGLGIGVVAPMAFAAVGDRAREVAVPGDLERVTDEALSRLNVFTYVGAVLGGVLTGLFATGDHLRLGIGVLAVLASLSALLAHRFREAGTPAASRRRPARDAGAVAGS